ARGWEWRGGTVGPPGRIRLRYPRRGKGVRGDGQRLLARHGATGGRHRGGGGGGGARGRRVLHAGRGGQGAGRRPVQHLRAVPAGHAAGSRVLRRGQEPAEPVAAGRAVVALVLEWVVQGEGRGPGRGGPPGGYRSQRGRGSRS